MIARTLVLTLVLAGSPATLRAQQPSPLSAASWLSGCWELRAGPRVTLEMWMPASGDMMLGASRTQVEGVTREFEHLRLSAEEGALVYTASPAGAGARRAAGFDFPMRRVSCFGVSPKG